MSNSTILIPRLNEKTYAMSTEGVYVFTVAKDVNKHSVKRAVESQFEVKVTSVRTTNVIGKAKRTISITGKRSNNSSGKRSDFKKAYVTLEKGSSLPFFDAVEEAEEKEQALQTKIDKAAEKTNAPRKGLHLRNRKDKAPEGIDVKEEKK
jgi:large subunit ribosomal protein L23